MCVTLYVLRSKVNGRRYVGITNDLPRRLREHASRSTQAGRLIGEFELLYTEVFSDHTTARLREKCLESGQGRKWLGEMEAHTRLAGGE